jgi:2-dehydropantoate 2-reductase
MKPRIAIVGAGAVGGYAGSYMAAAGEDVTFIDPWPEHVEAMRANGLRVTHLRDVAEFTTPVRAIHLTELQNEAKGRPFDIAFICMKSYDTEWATVMIRQYLAPGGFCVSLQNCMNEETIAGVVGWGRVLGTIASSITVELMVPGNIHRNSGKGGAAHTVYRVGEPHGRPTERAKEIVRLCALSDSATLTENLWGERWSKLVTNVMGNGMSACTGLLSRDVVADDQLRAFTARLGGEAIRVGQALGYSLEEILHIDPEVIARAGEGDAQARAEYDRKRIAESARGGAHRSYCRC